MSFGQIVLGAPGAGKTTYCHFISQCLHERRICLINLDPANLTLPYTAHINITSLITLADIEDTFQLGPNGSLLYAMEYLEKNIKWLKGEMEKFKGYSALYHYFIFDLPGQIELFVHHQSVKNIIDIMLHEWQMKLVCVHLLDSHHLTSVSHFLALLQVSLALMVHLSCATVHIFTKLDLFRAQQQWQELPIDLEYYLDVYDMNVFMDLLKQQSTRTSLLSHPYTAIAYKFYTALSELISSYNLVSFSTLDMTKEDSVQSIINLLDKSTGYSYSHLSRTQLLNATDAQQKHENSKQIHRLRDVPVWNSATTATHQFLHPSSSSSSSQSSPSISQLNTMLQELQIKENFPNK